MNKALGITVVTALVAGLLCGCLPGQALAQTHRYIYIPLISTLVDLEDMDLGSASLNLYQAHLAGILTAIDIGFTYLEGPEIPDNWLDSPSIFNAVMNQMKRVDVAVHTQGVDVVYDQDVFLINGSLVPAISYPPTTSDLAFDVDQCRLLGFFYFAWIYADINTGNVIADLSTVRSWEANHGPGLPGRLEIIFRKNFVPYKVFTYDILADDLAGTQRKAIGRETILEIVNQAREGVNLVIDTRLEHRHSPHPLTDNYPSEHTPVDFWEKAVGRFHACPMRMEGTSRWSRWLEPRLSRWPIRNPATPICPRERFIWYFPSILGFLHPLLSFDDGELCHDVDTWVELDSAEALGATVTWWSPYPPFPGFYEVLNPEPFDDPTARAWVFLHVAHNNGHRLIDTVNPVDGPDGPEVPSIIDVAAFDPLLYPATFDGGPKIHGFHKRQISPTLSELYKRFHYVFGSPDLPTFALRAGFFRANLANIISNVHIYVRNPAYPFQKVEINVPTFFQMIADRWNKDNGAYSLIPFAFLFLDMPEIDRGQGPPLVFEITCDFDTSPTLGGPYVPMRIIAEAHDSYYMTNYYGDVFYQFIYGLLSGGELPFP